MTNEIKPRVVLITYANDKYKIQQKLAALMGKYFGGFQQVINFGPEDIDETFRKANSKILSMKIGNGLWLWKPYIILKTLERINKGDLVFYCDSGAFFFRSVMPLIESLNKDDIWVSDIPLVEKQWTKIKVFEILNADTEAIKNTPQVQGGFILLRNSEGAVKFIREWLELACNPQLIMPFADREDRGECIDHRYDQSLLSILCKIRGVKTHKSPAIVPPLIFREEQNHSESDLNGMIILNVEHNEDKYKPCILLHSIRTAHNMVELIGKIIIAALVPSSFVRRAVKLKRFILRQDKKK